MTLTDLLEYAKSSQALQRAEHVAHPVFDRQKSWLGKVLPSVITSSAEPVLQAASDYQKHQQEMVKYSGTKKQHFDAQGNPVTTVGLLIQMLRLCGPERITSFWQLFTALTVFFYVLILVKVFKVDGMKVVNRPKFTKEYELLHKMVGKKVEKTLTKGSKKQV